MAELIDIDKLILDARRARDMVKLQVYTNIKAKKLEMKTAKNAKEYTPEVEISMLQKMKADLIEDKNTAIKANRQNLADEAQGQIEVFDELLPAPVSVDDVKAEVQKWIDANGPVAKQNQGLCIKAVKSALPGAEGKTISEIVRSYL